MKVLQVVGSMDPCQGGISQGIRNVIPALLEIGVRNEVVCMDDPKASYLGKDSFPIYSLGPARNPWAYSPKLKQWLKINIYRFDAVIVNGLWLYPGYAIVQIFKSIKGKVPILFVMPHGMLDPYFQQTKSRKYKVLRNWLYWKLIENKLIHLAEAILFTCEQELLLGRTTFRPYRPKKELNVGYGIPEPPPYMHQMSAKLMEVCPGIKGKPYFLFLSRIHEKKGVDLLINAYYQLVEGTPDDELPLMVIAGPCMDTNYGRKMAKIVDQSQILGKSIFFPGMLTGDAKWGAFYGCEAFVLPSHQENFGIAVIESLACGKPVLISDQVNIYKEILDVNAGIVASNSLEGTFSLLKYWIKLSPEKKRIMSGQAYSCFKSRFAIKPNALRIKNAINI